MSEELLFRYPTLIEGLRRSSGAYGKEGRKTLLPILKGKDRMLYGAEFLGTAFGG